MTNLLVPTWLCILLISCNTSSMLAQQSLFNVPSSELTATGKFFAQQQTNFSNIIQSNTTIDYGLKHNWEVGVNLLGIDYSESDHSFIRNDVVDGDPFAPLLLVNFQKGLILNHHWKLGLGTQQGVNLTPDKPNQYAQFSYAVFVYQTKNERVHFNAGLYAGNASYLGEGNREGVMLGTDVALIQRKVHLMGDWILGSNALGVAVVGVVMYPHHSFPVSLGWQIPNDPNGPNALVVELTWIP